MRDIRVKGAGSGTGGSRAWFDWHSWLGILAGLLLFLICWSGTVATLSNEIDWLLNPDQRVTPEGEGASLEAVHRLVSEAYPQARINSIYPPMYETFAVDVLIETRHGQLRHVYVDPFTLSIAGSGPYLNVQRYLRDFHRRLFAGPVGFYLVCLLSLPLLASLVTGLVFYRRWWKRFFEFKQARNVRGWVSNLHKLLGLWSLWFVVVIGITGAWYLWEAMRSDVIDGTFVHTDVNASAVNRLPYVDADGREPLPFPDLMKIARETRPDLNIGYIIFNRGGYFYVVGQSDDVLVRHRANKLFLNPYTGEVVFTQHAEDLSAYWRWSNMADPLHFGDFGGLISKVFWAVFGLFLSFLSVSGSWLFARRVARSARYLTKMRITLGVTAVAALGVLFITPLPLMSLSAIGPTINGEAQAARLLPGVLGFIWLWVISTWAIALSWVWMFFSSMQKAPASHVRTTTDRSKPQMKLAEIE